MSPDELCNYDMINWLNRIINYIVIIRYVELHRNANPQSSFNSLWPCDAIWQYKSGSTLVQVMACCLTAPSHYQGQCWFIIIEAPWHFTLNNFTETALDIVYYNVFENYISENIAASPRSQWIKYEVFFHTWSVRNSGGTRLGSAKSTIASLVSMKVDDRNRF